mgnify:FL=1
MSTEQTQAIFENVYRGRQSALHHLAYMRTSKVLLAMDALLRAGVELRASRVLDYGFGAGTFFRHCPREASLFGVETDRQTVREVEAMLRDRGFENMDLRPIDISDWERHPLLQKQYDVILCSHVLEHMDRPVDLLSALGRCMAPGGKLVCLVPINEIVMNPHHVQTVDRAAVEGWTREAGMVLYDYRESDHTFYPFQPLFAHDSGWRHRVARGVSLGFGLLSAGVGREVWLRMSSFLGRALGLKPCQAVFVLTDASVSDDSDLRNDQEPLS